MNSTARQLTRRFEAEGKATALDITPNGAYVIAGFTDGSVRLYPMLTESVSNTHRSGILLSRITAKGLITSLLLHIEITGDGRFAFAGVLRGSVEMFAYDLSQLPNDVSDERARSTDFQQLIKTYTNSDPKIRGFGAAVKLQGTTDEYRLACGLGIKNLHVWSFKCCNGEPEWVCIYDKPTNGMSLELLAFRSGGLEAVSKSNGQCIRVWNLSEDGQKGSYKDIVNTQDTLAIFPDFAFGGTYQLSLVKLDEDSDNNRMEIALPTPAPSAGIMKKRRCLCSVKSVIGAHDGSEIIVVCSDGVILYYNKDNFSAVAELIPIQSLSPEEEDTVIQLAAVGKGSVAVMVKARWISGENIGEIMVEPLKVGQALKDSLSPPSSSSKRESYASKSSEPPRSEVKKKRKALQDIDKNALNSQQSELKKPSSLVGEPKQPKPSHRPKSPQGSRGRDSVTPEGSKKDGRRKKHQQEEVPKAKVPKEDRKDPPARLSEGQLIRAPKPPLPPRRVSEPPPFTIEKKRKYFDPFTFLAKKPNPGVPLSKKEAIEREEQAEKGRQELKQFMEERNARLQLLKGDRSDGTTPSPSYAEVVVGTRTSVRTLEQLEKEQSLQREKLLSNFRAEHEWLRQRYVQAIEYESELNHCTGGNKDTKDYYNEFLLRQQSGSGVNGSPSNLVNLANVAEAQEEKADRLACITTTYKEMLNTMLRRQKMEAKALAAVQDMELPYGKAPLVTVEYPNMEDWDLKCTLGMYALFNRASPAASAVEPPLPFSPITH